MDLESFDMSYLNRPIILQLLQPNSHFRWITYKRVYTYICDIIMYRYKMEDFDYTVM